MEIDLGAQPFGLDFHPNDQLVATALITGYLQLYRYGDDSLQRLFELEAHEASCRAVRFINGGKAILVASGSSDCSILAVDLETGSSIARVEKAHKDAIYSMVNITESTIAAGDDKGFIKVWDTMQRTCCNSFKPHEEHVSDMTIASDSMKLLSTSGDGTLSVCNLRSNKVQKSECSDEDLSSVVVMKNGRKVICGSQNGPLLLYSWGFFKDCSDRFVDLSHSPVNALLKLDEERVIAASGNGLISVVGILPNRIIQPLAEHSEHSVEGLGFSHDRKFLGSISDEHDHFLKLWDLDELLEEPKNAESDNDCDEMEVDVNPPNKSKKASKRKHGPSNRTASNFFADL